VEYQEFLAKKSEVVAFSGLQGDPATLPDGIFPFQRDLVLWALRKGRAALFANTGLGKTVMQLSWSDQIFRQQGMPILIIAPLSVARQTVREGERWGIPVTYARSMDDVAGSISITNYEMVDRFDADHFGAVVADESSILKHHSGAYSQALIEQWRDTPFRLACTATPAPNDIVEIGTHAEFLGICSREDMLSRFFVHDDDGWRLKGHAVQPFYAWMATWAMALRTPSDLGYDGHRYQLPPLTVTPHWVPVEAESDHSLFFMGLHGVADRLAVRKQTMEKRVAAAVQLMQDTPGQWIAWVGLNDEGRLLHKALPDSVLMEGSDALEKKQADIEAFQDGKVRVLVTKTKMAGFGLNLQNAHQMGYVGLSDSFESWYQSIRRCWRFGQPEPVEVHVMLSDIEAEIFANVQRKEREAVKMQDALMQHMEVLEKEALQDSSVQDVYQTDEAAGTDWTCYLGDSAERLQEIPPDSIGLSVYSPPFLSLYSYSPSTRDLGNSGSIDEFFEHYRWIIEGVLRVTKPGRLTAVHCAQVAAMKERDGFIGLKDFRGDLIRAYVAGGWVYHGEVAVQKSPQIQSIRTHAKGLTFTQLHKDSSWMRPALADYILLFRKPGDNPDPVRCDVTNDEWIEWAAPVWTGIRETDTLNVVEAREDDDERHIAPLQLETIRRCVRLWSNPGDCILSPFAGIGSEGYVSVQLGRKFLGIELKPAYWRVAVKNLRKAEQLRDHVSLFDLPDAGT